MIGLSDEKPHDKIVEAELRPAEKYLLAAVRGSGGKLSTKVDIGMHRRTRYGAARRLMELGLIDVRPELRDTRTFLYLLTPLGKSVTI